MNFDASNWLAVVVCVLVSMVIGSFWFSPKTFFPTWWKAIGKTDSSGVPGIAGAMGLTWGFTILAAFVQAVFMSLMVSAMGNPTLGSGALAGFMLWLGFVAPSSLTNKLFAGQPKAWAIEAGNHLVNYVVIGSILGAWH